MGVRLSTEQEHNALIEEVKPKLKKPSQYKVVLFNDDYTPMDFVVEALKLFFNMNQERAIQVMLQVHTLGKAICGVYTYEIAETKVAQVNQYARKYDHPLLCSMEVV